MKITKPVVANPADPAARNTHKAEVAGSSPPAANTTAPAVDDAFGKVDNSSAATTGKAGAPSGQLFGRGRDSYFAALDQDPALRAKANGDAMGAMLDLLTRPDVPAALDRDYTAAAGSPGAGRLLMLLDYTRGISSDETVWEAAKQGPKHLVSEKIIAPMLGHFREVDGKSLFPGDATMTPAFRDSVLWGQSTNQVGHMLCAVETGVRAGRLASRPAERTLFGWALASTNKAAGFKNIKGTANDWSRAGIIGHEMRSDDDGAGFLGQMRAYDALVANGDPDGIRQHWDEAVAAVLRDDHQGAWKHIRAIGEAIEVPASPEELQARRADEQPRFATPHSSRGGNSLQDVGLSVYGFATGYLSATRGFPTAEAARAHFEKLYSAQGAAVDAIEAAAAADDA